MTENMPDNSEKNEELNSLSIDQINEIFDDIIEIPDDYFIAAASTASKHCHNARC